MLQKFVSLLLLSVLSLVVFGQSKIETDRPSETQSAILVPKSTFQAEIGFNKEQQNKSDYSYMHPDVLLRYGIFNHVELRLNTSFQTDHRLSENKSDYGLKPLELGIKGQLYRNVDTSFICSVYGMYGFADVASEDHKLEENFYRARLLFQNTLTKKLKLQYNIGRDWDDDDMEQNWLYSICPQYEVSKNLKVFIEEFGTFQSENTPKHYLDAGITYDVSKSCRVDVNAGKGLNNNASNYFVTAGFSFKIGR